MNRDDATPRVRLIQAATGGVWLDRQQALRTADLLLPPAHRTSTEVVLLDLAADKFEIVALQNVIKTLADRIRDGVGAPARLIVATRDPGVALLVEHLAGRLSLGVYIASGISAQELRNARPAGSLTPTEKVTLDEILSADVRGMTASELAKRFQIELTAAGNRLVNLEKRGLVYRLRQPGRDPDRFVDLRAALLGPTASPLA